MYQVRVTASGAALRGVTCESCGCQYLYRLSRRVSETRGAVVVPIAPGGARKSAERRLLKELKKGVDQIPCPDCGFLQRAMVRSKKWERFAIFYFLAAMPLMTVSIVLFVGDSVEHQVRLIGSILGGTILLLVILATVWIFRANFNTERKMAYRKTHPSKRALRRSDVPELPGDLFEEGTILKN